MKLSDPVVTAYNDGISVNGKAMRAGEAMEISRGFVVFKFHDYSTITEVVEVGIKKDHRKIKTIACIALLPL